MSYAKQFEIIYVDLYLKKAFFNEQSKEMQENNRMRKTRDLFKKTGDTKGTVHGRMGMIKDRDLKALTQARGD